MFYFSEVSLSRLRTCDPGIIEVAYDVIQVVDFSVACGHRSNEEQAVLWAQGRTTPGKIVTWARPGESRHNILPSPAIDVWPYPVDWRDEAAFGRLAGLFQMAARARGLRLEWGGDWPRDKRDLPHLQRSV